MLLWICLIFKKPPPNTNKTQKWLETNRIPKPNVVWGGLYIAFEMRSTHKSLADHKVLTNNGIMFISCENTSLFDNLYIETILSSLLISIDIRFSSNFNETVVFYQKLNHTFSVAA